MARLRATASAARSVLDGREHDGTLVHVGDPTHANPSIKKSARIAIKNRDHAQSDARRSHGGVPPSRWPPTLNGEPMLLRRARRVVANLIHATGMLGASLTEAGSGKALSDRSALEPYWGKPAVRNLRGDDGNGGIIRSPIRAIVLPDPLAPTSVEPALRATGTQCPGREGLQPSRSARSLSEYSLSSILRRIRFREGRHQESNFPLLASKRTQMRIPFPETRRFANTRTGS